MKRISTIMAVLLAMGIVSARAGCGACGGHQKEEVKKPAACAIDSNKPCVAPAAKPECAKKAENAKKKAKKPKDAGKDMTLKGKLTKKGKNFCLTTGDGAKIVIRETICGKGVKIADSVDSDVTIVGKGIESEKKGKKKISLKSVSSIKKSEA